MRSSAGSGRSAATPARTTSAPAATRRAATVRVQSGRSAVASRLNGDGLSDSPMPSTLGGSRRSVARRDAGPVDNFGASWRPRRRARSSAGARARTSGRARSSTCRRTRLLRRRVDDSEPTTDEPVDSTLAEPSTNSLASTLAAVVAVEAAALEHDSHIAEQLAQPAAALGAAWSAHRR